MLQSARAFRRRSGVLSAAVQTLAQRLVLMLRLATLVPFALLATSGIVRKSFRTYVFHQAFCGLNPRWLVAIRSCRRWRVGSGTLLLRFGLLTRRLLAAPLLFGPHPGITLRVHAGRAWHVFARAVGWLLR